MNATELNQARKEEKQAVSQRLIRLYEKLSAEKACIVHSTGYWAYEFCFHGDFIQYHQIKDGITKDPTAPIYRLGTPSKNLSEEDFEIVRNDVGGGDENSYVSQLISQGSICDITGKPRSTFIKFKCAKGLTEPVLESVSEFKTCQYQIKILVPDLCDLEIFQPKKRQVYDLVFQQIETEKEQLARKNIIDHHLVPLGFNLFIGAQRQKDSLTVLFTNKLQPWNFENFKESIIHAFTNALANSQFRVPGYVLRSAKENKEAEAAILMRPDPKMLSLNDKFLYISKLYDVNGVFIDNFELYFDHENGSNVSFGMEAIAGAEGNIDETKTEWYGTDVAEGEVLLGNFLMLNGVRFQHVKA